MKRHTWTPQQLDYMRQHYPDTLARDVAQALGLREKQVYSMAFAMGLGKSPEFLNRIGQEQNARRDHGNRATRFKPGGIPWNEGKKGSTGNHEKCRAHRFQPGNRPSTWVPIGSSRIGKDGELLVKFSDAPGAKWKRWMPYARIVCEAKNGQVPSGHVVVFQPGMKTADPEKITIDTIELVSRTDLARRNSIHRYPAELRELMRLRGKIARAITKAERA